jgi:hypothetical protein
VVYKVFQCAKTAAVLTLTPPYGNQLGGTPVLISGLCVEPGDIIVCRFGGSNRMLFASYVDESTILCITPVMTILGEVEVVVNRVLPEPAAVTITSKFITGM